MREIISKVGILVSAEGKLLLIKEFSKKRNGYFWNTVKGTFGDVPNETIIECATREIFEETGVDAEITNFASVYALYSVEKVGLQFNFIAKAKLENTESIDIEAQKARGEDIQEIKWFTKKELESIPSNEFISERSRSLVNQWLSGISYPLEVLSTVTD